MSTVGPWSDLVSIAAESESGVIPYLYKRLRALGVSHSAATKIANPDTPMQIPNIAPLAGGASAATIVTKVNELLSALEDAGAMEES